MTASGKLTVPTGGRSGGGNNKNNGVNGKGSRGKGGGGGGGGGNGGATANMTILIRAAALYVAFSVGMIYQRRSDYFGNTQSSSSPSSSSSHSVVFDFRYDERNERRSNAAAAASTKDEPGRALKDILDDDDDDEYNSEEDREYFRYIYQDRDDIDDDDDDIGDDIGDDIDDDDDEGLAANEEREMYRTLNEMGLNRTDHAIAATSMSNIVHPMTGGPINDAYDKAWKQMREEMFQVESYCRFPRFMMRGFEKQYVHDGAYMEEGVWRVERTKDRFAVGRKKAARYLEEQKLREERRRRRRRERERERQLEKETENKKTETERQLVKEKENKERNEEGRENREKSKRRRRRLKEEKGQKKKEKAKNKNSIQKNADKGMKEGKFNEKEEKDGGYKGRKLRKSKRVMRSTTTADSSGKNGKNGDGEDNDKDDNDNDNDDNDNDDDDDYYYKDPALNRTISYMHIGKAGGSSMSCNIREAFPYVDQMHCHMDKFPAEGPLESAISKQVNCYAHYEGNMHCHYINKSFLFNVRNPIKRIQSWYLYEHPWNTPFTYAESREMHGKRCGPLMLSSCYRSLDELATLGLGTSTRPDPSVPLRVGPDLTSDECSHWAWAVVQGEMPANFHNVFNYDWYSTLILDRKEKQPPDNVEIFVVRMEHLDQDWRTVDLMVGGNGAPLPNAEKPVNAASEKELPVTDNKVSDAGIANLCRALCREIQVYKRLLANAANLNKTDLDASMDELQKTCPEEVDIRPRECPELR